MTRFTDGKKTIEIELMVWSDESGGYSPDFSADFFEVGQLDRDTEKDAYVVEDVDYCIEQANDWKNSEGDFSEEDEIGMQNRAVFAEAIK